MTQSEFIKSYCKRSKVDEKKLNELGMFAVPCDCGGKDCKGWAMISKEAIRGHFQLYREA